MIEGKKSAKKEERRRPALERRYQRASCDFPAEFSWGTITHSARVRIISLGGCFLATEVMVPVGSELEVLFQMNAEAEAIVCQGRVVWIDPSGIRILHREKLPGFALEFLKIYPEHRAQIDDFVRRKTRLFRAILHELDKTSPDQTLVKELFSRICPGESSHLNHIRKVCQEELRYFRLRP